MSYAPIEALACDGRLTLLSVTPVPTTDQLSKTTVYNAKREVDDFLVSRGVMRPNRAPLAHISSRNTGKAAAWRNAVARKGSMS